MNLFGKKDNKGKKIPEFVGGASEPTSEINTQDLYEDNDDEFYGFSQNRPFQHEIGDDNESEEVVEPFEIQGINPMLASKAQVTPQPVSDRAQRALLSSDSRDSYPPKQTIQTNKPQPVLSPRSPQPSAMLHPQSISPVRSPGVIHHSNSVPEMYPPQYYSPNPVSPRSQVAFSPAEKLEIDRLLANGYSYDEAIRFIRYRRQGLTSVSYYPPAPMPPPMPVPAPYPPSSYYAAPPYSPYSPYGMSPVGPAPPAYSPSYPPASDPYAMDPLAIALQESLREEEARKQRVSCSLFYRL